MSSIVASRSARVAKRATLLSMGLAQAVGLKQKIIAKLAFNAPAQPGYAVRDGVFLLHYKRDKLVRPREIMPRKRRGLQVHFNTVSSNDTPSPGIGFVDALSSYSLRNQPKSGVPVLTLVPPHATDATPVILFSHGNSTDIGYSFPQLFNLCLKLDAVVVAYDYPGYGSCPGKPSEESILSTVRVVYSWLTKSVNCAADRVILYGQSMGSYPTCDVAADYAACPVRGVILQSPLASALRVLVPGVPQGSGRLERKLDCFRNLSRARRIPWPIFLIHGNSDGFVKPANARLLQDVAADLESNALEYSIRAHARYLRESLGEDSDGPVSQSLSPEMFLRESGANDGSFHSLLSSACTDFGVDERDLLDSLDSRVELWLVPGAGHSDVEQKAGLEFFARLAGFIGKVFNPQPSRTVRRYSE